jgi:hypothetical protein
MGRIAYFRRVSARVVQELRENPARVTKVLFPDATDTVIDEETRIGLDTTWHGVHYLLTGKAGSGRKPLDFILGGKAVGDIVVGEGPARAFSSTEVRAIAAALALHTRQTRAPLRSRQDDRARDSSGNLERTRHLERLLSAFDDLKKFVTLTAEAEAGMIVYM